MSDLLACAERLREFRKRQREDGITPNEFYADEESWLADMYAAVDFVLSSLDFPEAVQAAMERRKEYDAEMRDGKGRDTYHGTPHLWSTDNATIARHFLANPIQLLIDRELAEKRNAESA